MTMRNRQIIFIHWFTWHRSTVWGYGEVPPPTFEKQILCGFWNPPHWGLLGVGTGQA